MAQSRDDTDDGGPAARHIVAVDDQRANYGLSFLLWTDRYRQLLWTLLCLVDDEDDRSALLWVVKRARETRHQAAREVMRSRVFDSWAARVAAVATLLLALAALAGEVHGWVVR